MAKKIKSTSTVNVDAVRRDVSKIVREADSKAPKPVFGNPEYGEIAPGSVSRQSPLEQEMGSSKYREMIHNHNSKNRDLLDKLPFTFPKKKMVRSHLTLGVICENCNALNVGSENTVGGICVECKKYSRFINPEAESRGYDPEVVPGFLATADDLLAAKEKREQKT